MKCGKLSTQRGFTLIELMLVVAVVAILAAVAVPSYTQYTLRGYRAQAMAELLQYANWMQQQYTINNTYQPGGGPLTLPRSANLKYTFTINASDASTFTLWARPGNNDKCGTFTLDNTGLRNVLGDGTAPAETAANCWAGR